MWNASAQVCVATAKLMNLRLKYEELKLYATNNLKQNFVRELLETNRKI